MPILRTLASFAALSGLLLLSAPAIAQTACPEGKTASGACVNAELAGAMRESVRIFTQPRLSYSGPAVAPNGARRYDVLRDWRQGLTREIYGTCSGPNPCP
ncbi:MAG: hypothetical protein K2Y71_20415 [Xanthobacteraceae bacterium]|nr:hypothetical protein [Xanthobacteraceae bacterium]